MANTTLNTRAALEAFDKQLQRLNEQSTTLAKDLVELIDYTQMHFSRPTGHSHDFCPPPISLAVDTSRLHLATACAEVIRQHLIEALADFDEKLQEATAEFIEILIKYEAGADEVIKQGLERIDMELDDLNNVYEGIKEGIKVIPVEL